MGDDNGSRGGIYVSEFFSTQIYEYQHENTSNNPPSCTYSNILYPNDIAADDRAHIIDPDGGSRSIMIFQGNGQCGKLLATIHDKYGQPTDATSANAMTGTIAVANFRSARGSGHKGGTITLCTVKSGCTANLVNSNFYQVVGVAVARDGDCWATAANASNQATLTYFQGCTGPGETATGFENQNIGGLDIDKDGNLAVISSTDAQLYIYSGCNPACTLVSGPFALQGQAMYGHFNRQSMVFATADYQYGQVDVYKYQNEQLTYWYSFNNGLSASNLVEGVAYAPRSRE